MLQALELIYVLKRENSGPLLKIDLWGVDTLGTSVLYNRIVRGDAFIGIARETRRVEYGVIPWRRFEEDVGFRSSLERIRKIGIPGLLVHLPYLQEIESGNEFVYM